MADQSPPVPVPLPGQIPFLPQTPEQAAARDSAVMGTMETQRPAPPAVAMSTGSPAADDAVLSALEQAHSFISRVSGWKGDEQEKQQTLEMTAAAIEALTPLPPGA